MTIATDRRFEPRPIEGSPTWSAAAESAARAWLQNVGDPKGDGPIRAHPIFAAQAGGVDIFAYNLERILRFYGSNATVLPAKDNETVLVTGSGREIVEARRRLEQLAKIKLPSQ